LAQYQNTAKRIAKTPADKSPELRRSRPSFVVLPRRIAIDRVMPKNKTPMAAKVAKRETRESGTSIVTRQFAQVVLML